MKTKLLLSLVVLITSLNSFAQLQTRMLEVKRGLSLRVGERLPRGTVKADILYFHGFGDRLDNHMPLFKAWTDKGFRVISFDLPSHGLSSGLLNNIDFHSFEEIISYAEKVERTFRGETRVPLILAGWSTGGLIAVRAAQKEAFRERGIEGLILYAPAVSVPALVGRKGFLTQESLTSHPNPPHFGEISPRSPLLKPVFAAKLLVNAAAANHHSLPYDLPVLTMVAGDTEDLYVTTPKVKEWVRDQRQRASVMRPGFQCRKAFHELDNEPGYVGIQVRELSVEFAETIALGMSTFESRAKGPCLGF